MADEHFWRRVWTVRGAEGEAGIALFPGNKFWLEPYFTNDGALAYCELRFDNGMMDPRWRTQLRPAGLLLPPAPNPPLPPWSLADGAVRDRYMSVADGIADDANASMFRRLEGYFDPNGKPELARFFVLPGAAGGSDWFVLDVTTGARERQDGTGHGDPN